MPQALRASRAPEPGTPNQPNPNPHVLPSSRSKVAAPAIRRGRRADGRHADAAQRHRQRPHRAGVRVRRARGVGKTTTARILARALNCEKGPTAEPCGTCDMCVEIAEGRDIDVLEIDAATHTGVDNVRDVIIAGLAIRPVRDRYKIFIIDEVHQLSNSSFNALLKSMEEPPPHVVFMMATTELHKIPDTVLSRSQVFEFRTIRARADRRSAAQDRRCGEG